MKSLARQAAALGIIYRANLRPFERPDRLPRAVWASVTWASGGPAAALATGAARYPNAPAVVDDAGAVTFRMLWRRSGSLARELARLGAGRGTVVGLMCRNHRGFVEGLVGAAATGADVVLVNTGFSAPELAAVVASEQVDILVHDDEFSAAASVSGARLCLGEETAAGLATRWRTSPRPRRAGRIIVLTSGTTGRAKGAARHPNRGALEGTAAVLQRIPLRLCDVQVVDAPLFHAWGLLNLLLGLSRSATTVVQRRFDPDRTLSALTDHRARVLAVVPVMLRRILALGPERLVAADTSALEVIAVSGSALGAPLAADTRRRFGPVLYNVYGSTEVALATIATPRDLEHAPGTAGRPAFGSRVEILDETGAGVPAGAVGRVFVGSALRFDGYTAGGDKERVRGLVSTGDLGHFDGNGRLSIDGREDDMIVSGGENVFPGEVEEVLAQHPAISDAAVVGITDEEFGQALAAFVVRRAGTSLTADDVKAFLRGRVARYKIPRRVEFVADLPRTSTGKVLRRQLAER